MTLPTIKAITERFLFGENGQPSDLVTTGVIRDVDAKSSVEVNVAEYMSTYGPGRFAVGALFDIVQLFFSPTTSGIAPGEYTKSEWAALLGYGPEDFYGLNLHQGLYDDGAGDYAERAYVHGSTSFKIADTAVFVIEDDAADT